MLAFQLAFANVRDPGQRRITYTQFKHALFLASKTIYPGDDEDAAFGKVCSAVQRSDGPGTSGTEVAASGVYDRLINESDVYIPKASRKREKLPDFSAFGPSSSEDSPLRRVFLAFCHYGDGPTCVDLDNGESKISVHGQFDKCVC